MKPPNNSSAALPQTPQSTASCGKKKDDGRTAPTAASRALAIDHISDLICETLDTPSLLSVLRVNYSLYHSAGKQLYRHLYLGCGDPLLGALVGNDIARQQMIDAYHPCESVEWEEVFCLWKLSTLGKSQRPVKGKGKPGRKPAALAVGKESPAFAAMQSKLAFLGLPVREVKAFLAHLVDTTVGQLHGPNPGPGGGGGNARRKTRNFKLPLLHHVRVLTVESHHACTCQLWGPHVATLFPNVEVLRVVPRVGANGVLIPACDEADTRPCPFLSIKAGKLVLRNLDGRGPPIPGHLAWSTPGLERVSLYLPLDGAECARIPPLSLKGQFPHVKEITVVFHVWDGARVVDVLFPNKNPHLPDVLVDLLQAVTVPGRTAAPQIKIYGIEKLALDLIGPFTARADALMDTTRFDPVFTAPGSAAGAPLASVPGFLGLGIFGPQDEEFAVFLMDMLRCDAATGFIRTLWHAGRTKGPSAAELRDAMAPRDNVAFGTLEEYFGSKESEEDEQIKVRGIGCSCKQL